ncbi:MAG: inner membrane-spanning protein YciB [Paracoccaceae bacterium]
MSDDTKKINPVLKQVLELGPPLAFMAIYFMIRDETYTLGGTEYSGFIVASLVFIPIMLVAMIIMWVMTRTLSRMQIFTAFMVIFFGGLTAYFNDERFLKMRPTIVYGMFAVLLGIGLMRGESWLAFVLNEMMPMEKEGWMILTRRLAACFVGLAIANEIVWRTMSEEAWVLIENVAFPIVLMGVLFWQIMVLQEYLIEEKTDDQA